MTDLFLIWSSCLKVACLIILIYRIVIDSVPAGTAGIFHTGTQTGTRIPHVPPWVKFRAVSGHSSHSGQFRPIPTEMWISASIGFGLLFKKIYIYSKRSNNAVLDFTKKPNPIFYSILRFFHSQLSSQVLSLPLCSLLSLKSLTLSWLPLSLALSVSRIEASAKQVFFLYSHSLGLKLQPIHEFFFLMIYFVVKNLGVRS